ncbi:MAG TPA: potassium channel protein [Actinomycetota bacterium]|nr:potassium channel protein [Actinomycetota bacterium]
MRRVRPIMAMAWLRQHPLSSRLGTLVAIGATAYAYGVVGYLVFGFSLVDAAYMTALALTTAGFEPATALTGGEKVFTISVAFLGVAMFLLFLAVLTTAVAEGQLGLSGRSRRMQSRIASLKDHYIVCAYGRVGRAVAREFESEGVPFVVLDTKAELEDLMRADGVAYMLADPTQEPVLRAAGLERARGLVCAVDSDADNVYITLTARSISPELFIVARASDPDSPERLYRAGADRVISPYVSSGRHMALLGLRPRVVDYLDITGLGEKKIRLEEVLIETGSPFVGSTVAQVCGEAIPLLIRRNVGHLIPRPEGPEVLEAGDVLVVVGEPRLLRPVEG